jgi:hypothetical protein
MAPQVGAIYLKITVGQAVLACPALLKRWLPALH